MDASSLRKNSTQKVLEGLSVKKIKRIQHIKSLPTNQQESVRKSSFSKLEVRSKDQHQIKLKRFKTQQHLKPPHFGAVKTARERNLEMVRRKQQPSFPSKSLTKSTTYRSPADDNQRRKNMKFSKSKSKKSLKRIYSNLLNRAKEVMQEYQLKLYRQRQQKQQILKENTRLKSQLEFMSKRNKKLEKAL